MLIAYLNGSNHRLHRLYMITGLIYTDLYCGNSMSFLSVTFHLWVMHSHSRFGRTRFCSSEKKRMWPLTLTLFLNATIQTFRICHTWAHGIGTDATIPSLVAKGVWFKQCHLEREKECGRQADIMQRYNYNNINIDKLRHRRYTPLPFSPFYRG